jgi:hypothetical protein
MSFFTYRQNNSGGHWVVDENLSVVVIVEAHNSAVANDLAETIGVYFDGVGDCDCCGYRWTECDEEDATDIPMVHSRTVAEYMASEYVHSRLYHEVVVHYLDGKKETF